MHCEGILTPISCVHVHWYSENRAHAPPSDNFQTVFLFIYFCYRLLLFTPFRIEVIVLFLYHLFLYAITSTNFFSNWTHAFDYNFRKRYCRTSDITRNSIKIGIRRERERAREIQEKKYETVPFHSVKVENIIEALRYSNHIFRIKIKKTFSNTKKKYIDLIGKQCA